MKNYFRIVLSYLELCPSAMPRPHDNHASEYVMAPIYYCFNKLRFSKQVVLSLRLYDKEIITLVSLGIGSIMYWEYKIMYYARQRLA